MRTIFAEYNPQCNSIDVYTSAGYMLRIDCWEAEKNLKTTPGSDCALTSLAIDEPLEYARLYLDENLQMWVDAEDSLDYKVLNCDLQVLKTSVVMCLTVPIRFQIYFGFPEPPVFGVMPVPLEYAAPRPPVLSEPASFCVWYKSITHPDISVSLPHTALQVQEMTSRNRILRQFPQSYLVEYPH